MTRMLLTSLLSFALISTLWGCKRSLKRSDYAVHCQNDQECVTVFIGDICDQCACLNASIAKSSERQYMQNRRGAWCPFKMEEDCSCACWESHCIDNECELRP